MNPAFPAQQAARAPGIPGVTAPAGTFLPNTKVQVGNHRVVIDKYLSEGGFAHVYVVRLPSPVDGVEKAVLKRVAVPDKDALANMRTEVETMKKLKGHTHIVRYIDSHASALKDGGFEVFLLMEYCNGGGLIDFMNTRLQNRLTEPEILKIFSDTCNGVASMHYLKPPLLHRDLKVENVLVTNSGGNKMFKLCDFGSTAQPRPAATNAAEGRLIEEDVQKHTTMQYRSPEMIDVYRRQPIDEKSDIWALGVYLYKLCYYTTPFEEQGQMAILNASFKYPAYPQFSDRLKRLIAMMLQENPANRPNIYLVFKEVCSMRNRDCPLKDIYSGRTASEARKNQALPSPPPEMPMVGISKGAAPFKKELAIPDIAPMRRGRPSTQGVSSSNNPSPSPKPQASSDPFAALDGRQGPQAQTAAIDELSMKFPSLDQFSLLHDSGNKFAFDATKSPPPQQQQFNVQPSQATATQQSQSAKAQLQPLSTRVTEALADDAFAKAKPSSPSVQPNPQNLPTTTGVSHTAAQTSLPAEPKQIPSRPKMVSTGTMTSPSPPKNLVPDISARPLWRVPNRQARSASRAGLEDSVVDDSTPQASLSVSKSGLHGERSKSQTSMSQAIQGTLGSSGSSPKVDAGDVNQISRTRSTNERSRPMSTSLETAANFLRGRSPSTSKISSSKRPDRTSGILIDTTEPNEPEIPIDSNIDFLRQMEEEEAAKRKEKRLSGTFSRHSKRTSLPANPSAGTTAKNILSGRFGDAFKRFESSNTNEIAVETTGNDRLTPIPGSETIDGRSDDGQVLEETEDVSPEVRRELERRRLSQEERRVAEAAAQYKQRVASNGTGTKTVNRASVIQSRVQALLDESNQKSPTKTAAGYGRFTADAPTISGSAPQPQSLSNPPQRQQSLQQPRPAPLQQGLQRPSTTAAPERAAFARPSAPPKPQVLRTGGGAPVIAKKPAKLMGVGTGQSLLQQRLMEDQANSQGGQEKVVATAVTGTVVSALNEDGDWETEFGKRYPSLGNLEMEEMKI